MAENAVELAPGHKIGLPLASPVMLAAGSVGYGEARHRELETGPVGGAGAAGWWLVRPRDAAVAAASRRAWRRQQADLCAASGCRTGACPRR